MGKRKRNLQKYWRNYFLLELYLKNYFIQPSAPLPSFPLWTTHTGPFKGPYSFRLVILVTSFLVDKPKAKIRTTDKQPSKDLRG